MTYSFTGLTVSSTYGRLVQVINTNEYYDGFGNPLNLGAGPQGDQGPTGPIGPSGGPQGFQGPTGESGNTGSIGNTGPQGSTGPIGSVRNDFFNSSIVTITHSFGYYPVVQVIDGNGELIMPISISHSNTNSYTVDFGSVVSGYVITGAGTRGDTGPQGPSGGPQGFQGPTGIGPQGYQGVTGPQGATGNLGTTGPQGDTGPQGFTGSQGPSGNQGETGPQGAKGETGSQGSTGSQGDTGPQGATGSNLPFYYSTSAPTASSLTAGSRWFHSETGVEYVYIDDGDSLQWVQPTSTIAGSLNHYTSQIITSSYSIALNSQYGPEYFGVSSSLTTYVYLPTNVVVGKSITVKDESGKSSIHPIYIVAYTGETIDNNSSVQLAINYGSLTILRRNNNWWII